MSVLDFASPRNKSSITDTQLSLVNSGVCDSITTPHLESFRLLDTAIHCNNVLIKYLIAADSVGRQ